MHKEGNQIKRLTIVLQLLIVSNFCNAQKASTYSVSEIDDSQSIPQWYFTDTLITQLTDCYKNWTSIKLIDQVYPKYLNSYSLLPTKRKTKILDSTETPIRTVSKRKVNKIIEQLIKQIKLSDSLFVNSDFTNDPLNQYQLDSLWYEANIEEIWTRFRINQSIVLNDTQNQLAINLLKDYSALHGTLKTPNNWSEQESIMVDLKIEYEFDTLHIQATSYFVFALPWHYFNNKSMLSNSKISKLVGELLLLIKQDSDNEKRLSGKNFEMLLMNDIYVGYLKEKLNVP